MKYTMPKTKINLSTFIDIVKINVATFINQFFTLTKTDNNKLNDIFTFYSNIFLLKNCNLFSYCFDSEFKTIAKIQKSNQLQLNKNQLKHFYSKLKKHHNSKTSFVHFQLVALLKLNNPITVYSCVKKCNMQLNDNFPILIDFMQIKKNDVITQTYNTNCFNLDVMFEHDHDSYLKMIHKTEIFLQNYFTSICKLPESFFIVSKHKKS